eukprot:4650866-Pleurochrysis_carterae.AAC.1
MTAARAVPLALHPAAPLALSVHTPHVAVHPPLTWGRRTPPDTRGARPARARPRAILRRTEPFALPNALPPFRRAKTSSPSAATLSN